MGKIIFVVMGLLALFYYNSKKKRLFSPSSFLILIYLTSATFCIADIIINDNTYVLKDKYWPAAIVFLLLITGYLLPFIIVDETKWEKIKLPPLKVLNFLSGIIIILSFFSMIYYVTDVIHIFTSGDLARMREQLTGLEGEYTNSGIINTIASVSASFYDIALLLFFIYSAIGGHKNRRLLLLISSFSNTVQVLTYVGRDGVVFWMFSFFFDYFLFINFIPQTVKKEINTLFIKFGIIAAIPFLAISISRFGDTDTGTGGGMVSYIGQPLYHWCTYYGMDNPPRSIGGGWPLFYEITGIKEPYSPGRWEADGTNSWSFGTFLRSWYNSIGMIGIMLILFFMYSVFIVAFSKNKRTLMFHKLFVYLLFFEIISQGVFYFRQYTRGGNLSILLMFAFYFYYDIKEKSNKCVVIEKINDKDKIPKRKIT